MLQSDLFDIMLACIHGRLHEDLVSWNHQHACSVVCAAPGYPNNYPKGSVITGLEAANNIDGVRVYQAGTKLNLNSTTEVTSTTVMTNGGRVLAITGLGHSLKKAVEKAYSGVQTIQFDGIQFRKDIAHR